MRTRDKRATRIEPDFAPLEHIFDLRNGDFFQNMTIFNFSINRPDRPIWIKKRSESCVYPFLSEIHNIGHIHNTNFAQSQFSRSHPQKTRFLKKRHFTFFWKYLVCGLKIEISEYPSKVIIITYTPYKYEVNRTKSHEIRAKFCCVCFPSLYIIILFTQKHLWQTYRDGFYDLKLRKSLDVMKLNSRQTIIIT